MKTNRTLIPFLFLSLLLSACSTVQNKEADILARDNAISELKVAITQAESEDLAVYAPKTFNAAKEKYATALDQAKSSESRSAGVNDANEGLKYIAQANDKKDRSIEVLSLAYEMRDRSLAAGSASLYPKRTSEAEEELIEAAKLVESGNEQKARVKRDEIISEYTELELDSLKAGTTREALVAYNQAIEFDAEKYAPKSFDLAEKEIALTKKVIEADRTQVEKARLHAERAKYLSERAKEIAIVVKSFERRKFTDEDTVLWYHEQLDQLAEPMGTELKYNQSNEKVIAGLSHQIAHLNDSANDKQEQIDQLQAKVSSILTDKENTEFLQAQNEERYKAVEKMFSSDEARVYRIENGVLIKAHGFDFPVGSSSIEVVNYPLIRKIIDATNEFPDAKKISVAGHTDSSGSDELNMKLSKQRAANVKKLLVSIGEIPKEKIEVTGFGETKPVERNNTEQGRALNRRIEITIQ